MHTKHSEVTVSEKWKSYFTGIMTRSFGSAGKVNKYFHAAITASTSKAIEDNWIRILGIDYQILSVNVFKGDSPLGISLEGRNMLSGDRGEVVCRHFIRAMLPKLCIGSTKKFQVGDELLEVNGTKLYGLSTKDVLNTLKKLPNYIQIVAARHLRSNSESGSDYGGSEENLNSPVLFYDLNEELASKCSTLRSVTSNYSTTSRDFSMTGSTTGMSDGQHENVQNFLRDIIGWRGPIVLEFRKHRKESIGLALEEIQDPKSDVLIIVFKCIVPNMKAGKDGRIHVGDRLLQINGKGVSGVPFRKVCQMIKTSPHGRLVLCICKPHFKSIDISSTDDDCQQNLGNYEYESNRLPKLIENVDHENIPPAPDYLEREITIQSSGDKLGIFLDIVDDGLHGCRIKQISRGSAQTDGRLKVGDYITKANGVNLRISNRVQLDQYLRQIREGATKYIISYIPLDDVERHKLEYANVTKTNEQIDHEDNNKPFLTSPPPIGFVVDGKPLVVTDLSYDCDKSDGGPTFETFTIDIINDRKSKLGLVLSPSLNTPTQYVSIIDIHSNSLASNEGSLKINDDILAVNDKSCEGMSAKEIGLFLKKLLMSEDLLKFRVSRLLNPDDDDIRYKPTIQNQFSILTNLPDMYYCDFDRGRDGFGFSIADLGSEKGTVVDSVSEKVYSLKDKGFKSGHRFVCINNDCVVCCDKDAITGKIKQISDRLSVVMEVPKYREFYVTIVKDASNSLGLNVGGGLDTKSALAVIDSFIPNKQAKYSEQLEIGDFIVAIDEVDISKEYHDSIIERLKLTKSETVLKIWRRLPFQRRPIHLFIDDSDFPNNYIAASRILITLTKPVSSIKSFGLNLTDAIIMNPNDQSLICERYKIVLSVDGGSLVEMYAPQVKPFLCLVSINGIIVNSNMSCDSLKSFIDQEDRVNLEFSMDIPYYNKYSIVSSFQDYVIREPAPNYELYVNEMEHTENEMKADSIVSNDSESKLSGFCNAKEIDLIMLDNVSEDIVETETIGEKKELHHEETEKVENEQTVGINNEENSENWNTVQQSVEIHDETRDTENELKIENSNTEVSSTEMSDVIDGKETIVQKPVEKEGNVVDKDASNHNVPLKINVGHVIVPILANTELGFHLYGGRGGGPNGESLPIYVISVEKYSCNWPVDNDEPYLSNGTQLLELNDVCLTDKNVSDIEHLISTMMSTDEGDRELKFKTLSLQK